MFIIDYSAGETLAFLWEVAVEEGGEGFGSAECEVIGMCVLPLFAPLFTIIFSGASLCEDENLVTTTLQLVEDISKEHSKKVNTILASYAILFMVYSICRCRRKIERSSARRIGNSLIASFGATSPTKGKYNVFYMVLLECSNIYVCVSKRSNGRCDSGSKLIRSVRSFRYSPLLLKLILMHV